MIENKVARKRLIHVMESYGIKLSFIAKKLEWDYSTLNKFKNDRYDMSVERTKVLNKFLDQYEKVVI